MSPRSHRSAGESGLSQRRREKSRLPAMLSMPSSQYRAKMRGVRISPLKALLPSSDNFQSTVNFKCLVESSTGQAVLMKVCVCNLPTQVLRDAKIEEVANVQSTTCAMILVTAAKMLSEPILATLSLSLFDETVIEPAISIARVSASALKVECPLIGSNPQALFES